MAAANRANVGRDALIPPDLAAAQTPCRTRERHFKAGQSLRHGLRPCHLPLTREANLRQSYCPPGRPQLCVIATPVGDDACIVPGDPAAAPTSPGGINPAPTAHGERPANRGGRGCPGKRRAGYPHPAGPCGSANTLPHPGAAFQGGAIPPSRPAAVPPPFDKGGKSAAKLRPGGKAASLRDRYPCRGRCLHRPGRPCGGANVPGRDKSRPYGPRRTPGQPGRPRLPGQT